MRESDKFGAAKRMIEQAFDHEIAATEDLESAVRLLNTWHAALREWEDRLRRREANCALAWCVLIAWSVGTIAAYLVAMAAR